MDLEVTLEELYTGEFVEVYNFCYVENCLCLTLIMIPLEGKAIFCFFVIGFF